MTNSGGILALLATLLLCCAHLCEAWALLNTGRVNMLSVEIGLKRYVGPGHVNALPDEVLSHILRLLPFSAKAAAHSVSKRWRVLRHPLIADLWEDCELDLTADALTADRERELWTIADCTTCTQLQSLWLFTQLHDLKCR